MIILFLGFVASAIIAVATMKGAVREHLPRSETENLKDSSESAGSGKAADKLSLDTASLRDARFRQEQEHTCGPAILRSVVLYLTGTEYSETEMAALLRTGEDHGTPNENFAAACKELSRRHPIEYLIQENSSVEQLEELVAGGYAIILNYMFPETAERDPEGHFGALYALNNGVIELVDPAPGTGGILQLSLPGEADLPAPEFRWHGESGYHGWLCAIRIKRKSIAA